MSSLADNASTALAEAEPTPRRRRDAQASRLALLDAADELFDERGYEAATIREIGERAGVDAALIARYFGAKEGLYLATLQREPREPVPSDPLRVLDEMLRRSEQRGSGPVGLAMVSPTLSDDLREQVREIIGRRVVRPLRDELTARGIPHAELHAELLVAIAVGVALTRASGTLPALAEASLEQVMALLAPLLDALAPAERA
jgi:AcrR family transcriptional regulator